jgi:hypothetical protein
VRIATAASQAAVMGYHGVGIPLVGRSSRTSGIIPVSKAKIADWRAQP